MVRLSKKDKLLLMHRRAPDSFEDFELLVHQAITSCRIALGTYKVSVKQKMPHWFKSKCKRLYYERLRRYHRLCAIRSDMAHKLFNLLVKLNEEEKKNGNDKTTSE